MGLLRFENAFHLIRRGENLKHLIKSWNRFFRLSWDGKKSYEIRNNDREFQLGDFLEMVEVENNEPEIFTGRKMTGEILSILNLELIPGMEGNPAFVVLGMDWKRDGEAATADQVQRWKEFFTGAVAGLISDPELDPEHCVKMSARCADIMESTFKKKFWDSLPK